MESASKVLAIWKIAPRLAASRRVNHRKQGGRNIDPGDAAHPSSGGKAGQIACDAAAKRDNRILAAKPSLGKGAPEFGDSHRRLVLFSRWNDGERRDTKATRPEPSDRLIRHDIASCEDCRRNATANDNERRLRIEKRGDAVRERRVMRGAFLGLITKGPRPRRHANATRKFLVRRSVKAKDSAVLFAKRSVLVAQKSAATKRNDSKS